MNCTEDRSCGNCGHYEYDSHADEAWCMKDACLAPGDACEDWVCQYKTWCDSYSERITKLKEDLEHAQQLYAAERLLRIEAEKARGG